MFRSSGLIEILKNPEFFVFVEFESIYHSIFWKKKREQLYFFVFFFSILPKNSSKSLSLVSSSFTLVSVSLLFMGFIL